MWYLLNLNTHSQKQNLTVLQSWTRKSGMRPQSHKAYCVVLMCLSCVCIESTCIPEQIAALSIWTTESTCGSPYQVSEGFTMKSSVACTLGFFFFACRQLLKIILKPEHFLPKGRRPWWSQRKPPLVKGSMFKITINKRMTSSIYEHFLFREMCSFMFLLWVWW